MSDVSQEPVKLVDLFASMIESMVENGLRAIEITTAERLIWKVVDYKTYDTAQHEESTSNCLICEESITNMFLEWVTKSQYYHTSDQAKDFGKRLKASINEQVEAYSKAVGEVNTAWKKSGREDPIRLLYRADSFVSDTSGTTTNQPEETYRLEAESRVTYIRQIALSLNLNDCITADHKAQNLLKQVIVWIANDCPDQKQKDVIAGSLLIIGRDAITLQYQDQVTKTTRIASYSVRNVPLDIYTSQEFNAVGQSMIDGISGRFWQNDSQDNARIHRRPNSGYFVRLTANRINETPALLENLTEKQDIDGMIATHVIASTLASEIERDPTQKITSLLFDLVDVGKKIGFDPHTKDDTRALREKVFSWFNFLTRAQVVGSRSIPYKDKTTGKIIETRVEAPMIQILETQSPVELSLFGDAPVTMQVALTPTFKQLLCDPNLRQSLPYAERIAAIKPKQPGGAWARSIGVSLWGFWRRNINKDYRPTRRELLALDPTKAVPRDILQSDHPKRAAEYWYSAMRLLVINKTIADDGEAKQTVDRQLKGLPRKDWQEMWLDQKVDISPATDIQQWIDQIAANKYNPRPKELLAVKRRGRPPKLSK